MTYNLLYPPSKQKQLTEELIACRTDEELHTVLVKVNSWNWGQFDLNDWHEVYLKFDRLLKMCCTESSKDTNGSDNLEYVSLPVDLPEHSNKKELLLLMLSFIDRVVENSASADFYLG